MARAEIVLVPPTAPPPEKHVALTLSYDEAATLLVLTDYVSGSPTLSGRRFTDAIASALSKAGVDRRDCPFEFDGDVDARS